MQKKSVRFVVDSPICGCLFRKACRGYERGRVSDNSATVVCQLTYDLVQAANNSCAATIVDLVGCILWRVVERIPIRGAVGDHQPRISILPKVQLIRPVHSLDPFRGGKTFGGKWRAPSEGGNGPPDEILGLLIADEPHKIAGARI